MFFRRRSVILVALITGLLASTSISHASGPSFSVSFPKSRSEKPLDGRIFLLLSSDPSAEPRMQIDDSVRTQMIFGMDVDGMQPGQAVVVDDSAAGYPIRSLRDVPPGEYYVQAVLHRYETFHRSDGHTVKLPMDRGEGQHWNIAPGNLYSAPRKITLGPSAGTIAIVVDQEIPPIPPPQDTKYIRHLKIQSALLTKFWGRPIFLSANVLVPEGFDEHPGVHFPLIISEDHFNADFGGFRTEPPDPNLKPDYSERFHISGYNRIQQEEAYKFYQQWTAPGFPRVLIADINTRQPLLRRFLRGELRQSWALRRRHRDRTHSRDRETISRHRTRLGAVRLRRFDWRLGIAGGPDVLSRPLQRRLCRLP